ncbi:MAG TPA: hypothetical protein IGR64_10905 [Leptolyngbyaceae cyanobacterium M65_K2018_010]|nr:hypothetical protein [Leptolyngbyaceae cyanobacterium M65_K2018_010]
MIDPIFFTLLGSIMAVATALVTVVRSLDNRFNQVRSQLAELDQRLAVTMERLSTREASHWEMLDYRANANRELIEHRSQRWSTELQRVDNDLRERIKDIEAFLDRTTEFVIRAKEKP